MALYIYLHYYIIPTLFAYLLAYHPHIFLHSQPYYKEDLFSIYSYTVALVTAVLLQAIAIATSHEITCLSMALNGEVKGQLFSSLPYTK